MLNGDFPPPIYTSPMGQATTVTIQAFPLSEAIMGVVAAHEDPKIISKEALTVNSLTMDYNEPMDAIGEATSIEASVEPGKVTFIFCKILINFELKFFKRRKI